MPEVSVTELRQSLRTLLKDADEFFSAAAGECKRDPDKWMPIRVPANEYWNNLSEATAKKATMALAALLPLAATLAQFARTSPLTDLEDVRDVKIAAKSIRAALRLRQYTYREAEAIHDEDVVLGFRPAEQSDDLAATPLNAKSTFQEGINTLTKVLSLVEAASTPDASLISGVGSTASKYRANTGFIMMWMDPKQPNLIDVADTIREVFQSFGIRALRADDIEHEGLITERVLNEIRTAEFLFADLTGARPNVYYEVGFAHALGKRVILFRKAATELHFDISTYNCPEYESLRELREKLTKRLTALTNRNPSAAPTL